MGGIHPLEAIKDHPYLFGGILLGGVALWFIFSGTGSASGTTTTSAVDPNADALYAQQSQQQYGLSLDAQQAGEQLQLATLQAQTSTTQQTNAITGNLDLQNLTDSTQVTLQQNQLASADYQSTLTAQTELASQSISANEALGVTQLETQSNVQIAGINAQTQALQAQYGAQVLETEANSQVNIAKIQAGASTTNSIIGAVAGIAAAFL